MATLEKSGNPSLSNGIPVSGCFFPARSLLRIVVPGGIGTGFVGRPKRPLSLPCAGCGRSEGIGGAVGGGEAAELVVVGVELLCRIAVAGWGQTRRV